MNLSLGAAVDRSAAIAVDGLVKNFGSNRAVDGISFEVPMGTVTGLLGPNGAGKTTTVRILATLAAADAGTATVLGYDVARQAHQVRQLIGLTGQYAGVDEKISGLDNLYLICRLHEMPARRARARAAELIEQFDLADAAKRIVREYSGGMRRRLDLAASLVAAPRVLFLDEPTTGLDPRSRRSLWELVRGLTEAGTTVLLTTQYMEEAEALADTVIVIDRGAVVAEGPTMQLRNRIGGQVLHLTLADPTEVGTAMRVLASAGVGAGTATADGATLTVALDGPHDLTTAIRVLGEARVAVADISTRVPTLDEVFLTLTGNRAAEPDLTASTGTR